MSNFITKYLKERRHKKDWGAEVQLARLRSVLDQDNQWMHHNKIARELTQRYLDIAREGWEKKSIYPSDQVRQRLKLDPHHHSKFCNCCGKEAK